MAVARIARCHLGMAEEFGALSFSLPSQVIEDVDGPGMVWRIGEPFQAFIRAGPHSTYRSLARRVGADAVDVGQMFA